MGFHRQESISKKLLQGIASREAKTRVAERREEKRAREKSQHTGMLRKSS